MSTKLQADRPRTPGARRRPAIHQFHPGITYGDAVSNGMLLWQQLLRGLGFESDIFVARSDPRVADRVRHHREYVPKPENLLLVHHSLGHELFDWVVGLPDRKVLVYHNITPVEFFADDPFLRAHAELGREQLARYREHMTAAFCDSPFNAAELTALGYAPATVLPVLFDVDALRKAPWNASIVDANAGTYTMLFVGRVERNKCIHDVIEVFHRVCAWLDRPSRLVIVGRHHPEAPYIHELRALIAERGLGDHVQLLGHVPSEDLRGWYRAADVFLSMSEHEGFGVPLIEAMTLGVPVIAHAAASVPDTLGDGGILVEGKSHDEIAGLVCLLSEDAPLRRRLVRAGHRRSAELSLDALRPRLVAALTSLGLPMAAPTSGEPPNADRPAVQIEGSFESSYSLAIVNRELALALDAGTPGAVGLFATEGPGDYEPDRAAIAAMPDVERLWRRGRKGSLADVVVRNMYPPRVADMDGVVNLLNFFWEESALSPEWVATFNRHLGGICVASHFVRKVLIDAGVHVPIRVIGGGIDHVLREPPARYLGPLGRAFRFLHVSSAFPRKGIDVLLAAYAQAFSDADDVTLVLKTFPNIHNETAEQIRALREGRTRCPDIVHIDGDLPAGQLADLYRQCHAFVAPTRGEGFGLPMAEAMLTGVPVVTTAFGGHRDFCRDDVCWPVDFTFARSRSHMGLFDSVWAEPDLADLTRALRAVYDAPAALRSQKTKRAAAVVTEQCTWARSAAELRAHVAEIDATRPLASRPIRLGWATSWNSKCGIARYSAFLLEHLPADTFRTTILASRMDQTCSPDGPNVRRCWGDSMHYPDVSELQAIVADENCDAVVLQFNFGFFCTDHFGQLIDHLADRNVCTVIVFHSTRDGTNDSLRRIRPALARADRLVVHSINDLNRLKRFGLVENVVLWPQGVLDHRPTPPDAARRRVALPASGPIIGSYGFLLPHKGVEQLLEGFPQVLRVHPDARLLLVNAIYPNPDSTALQTRCRAAIDRLGLAGRVHLVTDFLDDAESLCLLECADLVVYPYQGSDESSSAAVRFGLASGRPVACTPAPIFDDVADVVHFLPGPRPAQIAQGILELIGAPDRLAARAARQREWVTAHAWPVVARRFAGMLRGLLNDRERAKTTRREENDVQDPRRRNQLG